MNAYHEKRNYSSSFPVNAFYSKNNNFLAHWHIDIEVVYVLEGSIRIGVNKDVKILRKGEMAVFGSMDIHYYDSTELESSVIILIFKPDIIGNPGGWPGEPGLSSPFITKELMNTSGDNIHNRIEDLLKEIVNELDQKYAFYEMQVTGDIFKLCSIALRYFPINNEISPEHKRSSINIQRMQTVIKYIEKNYAEPLTLLAAAKLINLSPFYFSRLFKEFTGINFSIYLARVRIEKAEYMIKTTDSAITDISFDCGFNSIRTFNRIFKNLKGYAPTKIKRSKKIY